MKATVIGDGGWGTALAMVLQRNGHGVTVWGPFAGYASEVERTRENAKFLAGVRLPEGIRFTADHDEAGNGAEVVVIAVPSRFYREVLEGFRGRLPEGAPCLSVSKGLDRDTRRRMTEVAEAVWGRGPVAALSGPSHAEEVARGVPSAVAIACAEHARAVHLQGMFNNPTFRVYTSDDVVGVELGGAMKNVIAVAAAVIRTNIATIEIAGTISLFLAIAQTGPAIASNTTTIRWTIKKLAANFFV